MADETYQDKTQQATPKKRQDAAKKGQVPRSQEVTTAFLLLAGAAVLSAAGGVIAGAITDLFGRSVMSLTALTVGSNAAAKHVAGVGWMALGGMAPAVLALSGTALAVSAVQARGIITTEPLKPQWERLDPFKKAKQIWGIRSVAELVKSFLKLLIVSLAAWLAVRDAAGDLAAVGQSSPYALLDLTRRYAVRILRNAGLAYLVLALADYAYQVWQHEKQLRMSHEEVKKELKESEGDQVVKVRRRTMSRQLARRRMMLAVSDADVVITNPTHIAVALKYDPDVAHAPVVLALCERKVAERIKQLASEAGVPTIEYKPLARSLLSTARLGMPIPVVLFVAVAEVLAFVYRMRVAAGRAYGART